MYMLERLGFGARWRRWIHFCISTVRLYVLVNQTPAGFFLTWRGVARRPIISITVHFGYGSVESFVV